MLFFFNVIPLKWFLIEFVPASWVINFSAPAGRATGPARLLRPPRASRGSGRTRGRDLVALSGGRPRGARAPEAFPGCCCLRSQPPSKVFATPAAGMSLAGTRRVRSPPQSPRLWGGQLLPCSHLWALRVAHKGPAAPRCCPQLTPLGEEQPLGLHLSGAAEGERKLRCHLLPSLANVPRPWVPKRRSAEERRAAVPLV